MSPPRRRRAERSAGAFLGPDILVPASLRTLSDEYQDVRTYPEDEREPEPEPQGLFRRVVARFTRRPGPHH
jgi:hypothetical protein